MQALAADKGFLLLHWSPIELPARTVRQFTEEQGERIQPFPPLSSTGKHAGQQNKQRVRLQRSQLDTQTQLVPHASDVKTRYG